SPRNSRKLQSMTVSATVNCSTAFSRSAWRGRGHGRRGAKPEADGAPRRKSNLTKFVDRLTAADLLPALDTNMAAYWAPYGRGAGCILHETPGAVWFYTGVPHPLFNGVISARFAPDEVDAVRGALQAQIRQHGAPALWWIGPLSRPENLGALLTQSGLQPAGQAPGMAVALAALPEAEAIAGVSIERIDGAAKQGLWARIAAIGTGFSDTAAAALERIEASLGDPQYRAQHR